ncbi:ABC transporter permease [Clostridium sp. LIBA-8841]|uniref:ABC transporter permease n=1 Tax=Clostridium sp. LIBA-8841 TaxID=2987530 RepID=UPI002AC4C88F|nr:ABC transporter permease [Clostridium sp. LIBA-8841]MDZ5253875.1 ABC transporter permease [Clostridium sp. LIBA-8841]
MKKDRALKIVDRFRGLYEKLGVDYEMMKLILETKLIMDKRRAPTITMNNKYNEEKENKFGMALGLYALMGAFMALVIVFKYNIMLQMTLYFGFFMFVIGSSFITDFAYVLLDIKDKNLLGITGVSSKTINAAKITNILIYMTKISLAYGGAGIIVSLRYGIVFTVVFILEIILINLFMVLITAFIYYLVLKFFNGEKLKDIINGVQIFLTVGIMVMYQIIGRLFNVLEVESTFTVTKWWQGLIPSLWFAAPLEIVESGKINNTLIMLTILAVLAPLVSILIYFKIAKKFEDYIQKLNNNTYKGKDKIPFSFRIGNLICRSNTEKSFFNFTVNIIKSERNFKLRTYPNLAMALIFPFIFLANTFDKYGNFTEWKTGMAHSNSFFTLYLGIFILAPVILMIKYSDQFKAAWIYKAVPIDDMASIFKGAYKGVFYKMVLPVYILLSLIFLWIFTLRILPQIIAIFLVIVILSLIALKAMDKHLPFSISFKDGGKMDDLGVTILIFILSGILGGMHYFINKISYGVYIFIALELIIIWILWTIVSRGKYYKV